MPTGAEVAGIIVAVLIIGGIWYWRKESKKSGSGTKGRDSNSTTTE